jgi:pimeloyl-ACP methyl ester carboxylesterase
LLENDQWGKHMGLPRITFLRFAALLCCAIFPAADSFGAAPKTISVGELTLTLCRPHYTGYCGSIQQAIDPAGVIPGKLTVGFEYYPRTDLTRPRLGTILPQEGGPGYSSTGTRDYYLEIYDALRDRRDVLIVDKRGTGLSSPIDCADMQTGATDLDAVAACATQLGDTAWFYGTDFAANDIIAVLDALGIEDVDFYGDSYGTFVGQILAGLYPHRLRSIVLDSAYPVRPPDPWFGTDWAAAWSGIDTSCARSPSCSSLGGTATSRMQQIIDIVREQPIHGKAPDGNGVLQPTTIDTAGLIYLIDYAGFGPPVYRDLDAAARAWLTSHDALPMLRLISEADTASVDEPVDFSYGLYEAVTCSDYPMLYDMYKSRAVRDQQYAASLQDARENRPDLFAPFTVDEGIESQVFITPLNSCLPWHKPPQDLAPGTAGAPLPPSVQYPAVPTLVLSGDLDSITSVIDANETAAQFPNAVHVIVPNLGHVVTDSDEIGCTLGIVHRFVRELDPGNTNCVNRVRPVRTVPLFALQASELEPLQELRGDKTSDAQRRIAAAGLEAVGDAIARWYVTYNSVDTGLRGGKFTYRLSGNTYIYKLTDYKWTKDVAVSGNITWDQTTNIITAQVTLKSDGSPAGNLQIHWNDGDIDAMASVTGQIQGATLIAQRIAP